MTDDYKLFKYPQIRRVQGSDPDRAKELIGLHLNRYLHELRRLSSFAPLEQNARRIDFVDGPYAGGYISMRTVYGQELVDVFVPPRGAMRLPSGQAGDKPQRRLRPLEFICPVYDIIDNEDPIYIRGFWYGPLASVSANIGTLSDPFRWSTAFRQLVSSQDELLTRLDYSLAAVPPLKPYLYQVGLPGPTPEYRGEAEELRNVGIELWTNHIEQTEIIPSTWSGTGFTPAVPYKNPFPFPSPDTEEDYYIHYVRNYFHESMYTGVTPINPGRNPHTGQYNDPGDYELHEIVSHYDYSIYYTDNADTVIATYEDIYGPTSIVFDLRYDEISTNSLHFAGKVLAEGTLRNGWYKAGSAVFQKPPGASATPIGGYLGPYEAQWFTTVENVPRIRGASGVFREGGRILTFAEAGASSLSFARVQAEVSEAVLVWTQTRSSDICTYQGTMSAGIPEDDDAYRAGVTTISPAVFDCFVTTDELTITIVENFRGAVEATYTECYAYGGIIIYVYSVTLNNYDKRTVGADGEFSAWEILTYYGVIIGKNHYPSGPFNAIDYDDIRHFVHETVRELPGYGPIYCDGRARVAVVRMTPIAEVIDA